MKTFFTILTGAVLALSAMTASAQLNDAVYASQNTAVYTCAASAATNVGFVIDVKKQKDICCQFEQIYKQAGTANLTFWFAKSVDGVTYETTLSNIPVAGNGNTQVLTLTNIASLGAGFIKFVYITNASAAGVDMTNGIIRYAQKIKAP